MAEEWQSGAWLLIDAAGPETVYGILHEGEWAEYLVTDEAFVAGCQPAMQNLVCDSGLGFENVSGVLYAMGPGSTLGLRLAAMFLRSLLKLPGNENWKCACYNNLELAAVSLLNTVSGTIPEAVAPWRRDRVHRARVRNTQPLDIVMDSLPPEDLDPHRTCLFLLGKRARNLPPINNVTNFPIADIPDILAAYPGLLSWCDQPSPFTAESPDFARWSSKRHTAP